MSQLHRRPTAFITDPALQKAIAEASQRRDQSDKVGEEQRDDDEEYVLQIN